MEQKIALRNLGEQLKVLKQKSIVKGCHVDMQKELLKGKIRDIKISLKHAAEYVAGQHKRKHGVLVSGLSGIEDTNEARRVWIRRIQRIDSTTESSIESLITRWFDKKCYWLNTLNNLRHQKKKLKLKFDKLNDVYRELEIAEAEKLRLKNYVAKTASQLDNDRDKAVLKYQMTFNITHKFRDIIRMLQKDSWMYNSRLDKVEAEIMETRVQIYKFNQRKLGAQEMAMVMQAELAAEENRVNKVYKAREIALSSGRIELEEKRRQIHLYMRDALKLLSLLGIPKARAPNLTQITLWKTEQMAKRIKEKMCLQDLKAVALQLSQQDKFKRRAAIQLKEAEKRNEALRQKIKEEKKNFEDYKYSTVLDTSMVEKMKTQLEQAELKLSQMKEDEKSHGDLFIRLQLAINNMVNMLAPVELESELIGDEIFDKFDRCLQKINKLLKIQDTKGKEAHMSQFDLQKRAYYNYIEEAIPMEAKPIMLNKDLEMSKALLSAISLHIPDQEMVTREQIKDANAKVQAINKLKEGNK